MPSSRLKEFYQKMKGAKVAVLGVGISNRPLIRFIHSLGAEITAFDALPYDDRVLSKTREDFEKEGIFLQWSVGDKYLSRLATDSFTYIFRTPQMRPDIAPIREAIAGGSILTSEMEVFMDLCPAKIFAVTGSDGKTTTTTLLSLFLKEAGYRVFLGGNIGTPLLNRIAEVQADDMVVLELSSFQLFHMAKSADVSVVTNISPNHLNVHTDYQEYIDVKKNIFRYQSYSGRLVLNADNDLTRAMMIEKRGEGVYFSGDPQNIPDTAIQTEKIVVRDGSVYWEGKEKKALLSVSDILLPGAHNVENYMAAMGATCPWVSPEIFTKVARSFPGVEHRSELVRTYKGIRIYNSSIDSSPNRTIHTLRTFAERGDRGVLIAGGADKKSDYTGVGDTILRVCDRIVLCGPNATQIKEALKKEANGRSYQVFEVEIWDDLVQTAINLAVDGEIVILSPAGTSYDSFRHFEERGNRFKELVSRLS